MRRVLAALAVLVAVLLPGAPAWAHNQLAESSPAADAALATAPTEVRLRFLQKLNPSFTTIVLSDAARQRVPTGAPAVDGATGTVTIDRALADGAYTVAYRTVSVDGHVVQGSYVFTVGRAEAAGAAEVSAPAAAAPRKKGGISVFIAVGCGVALLVMAALFLRRRKV